MTPACRSIMREAHRSVLEARFREPNPRDFYRYACPTQIGKGYCSHRVETLGCVRGRQAAARLCASGRRYVRGRSLDQRAAKDEWFMAPHATSGISGVGV